MERCWNIHTVFALLIAGFWELAEETGLDPEEMFASMEKRLRENLLTRVRLA